MNVGRLDVGLELEYKNQKYVIVRQLESNEYQLQNTENDKFISLKALDIAHYVSTGELKLNFHVADKSLHKIADINLLPDHVNKENDRKLKYVKNALKETYDRYTKKNLEDSIKVTAAEINDLKNPGVSTVYKWIRRYIKCEKEQRSLVSKKYFRIHSFSGDVRVSKIVGNKYREIYLTDQRATIQSLYEKILGEITDENKKINSDTLKMKVPSERSIYRYVKNASEYEKSLSREGEHKARAKFLPGKLFEPPTRILERVEVDFARLDLIVVHDQNLKVLGRPWVIFALDCYSRALLGFFISFDAPGYSSVMEVLIRAIMPKNYIIKDYPKIRNFWNQYGVPEMVVCDNGDGFQSESFVRALNDLGIILMHSPPGYAWERGKIERFNESINTNLIHQLPGTTWSNYIQKGDYDSEAKSVIKFETLVYIIHVWIIDKYNHKFHEGIKDFPADVWDRGAEEFPPRMIGAVENLAILLGSIESKKLRSNGVLHKYIQYNSPALKELHKRYGNIKVEFKFNPNDLSKIFVIHPEKHSYITAPALDQKNTKNLTLWKHQKSIDLNNERRREQNWDNIVAANNEIDAAVKRDAEAFEKYTAKMSRWVDTRQAKHNGTGPQNDNDATAVEQHGPESDTEIDSHGGLNPPTTKKGAQKKNTSQKSANNQSVGSKNNLSSENLSKDNLPQQIPEQEGWKTGYGKRKLQ
jgi:putative transposase